MSRTWLMAAVWCVFGATMQAVDDTASDAAVPNAAVQAEGTLPAVANRTVSYVDDVEPILKQRCWRCHGVKRQRGGLRLDVKEAAHAGGDSGIAFAPGESASSELIRRILSTDEDRRMPPKGQRLSQDDVGVLRAWIDQGATYSTQAVAKSVRRQSEHWSFQPVQRPELTQVEDREWVRTPIDGFVLSRLEREGLSPSPEADRPTLIRRLSLDLTGLLPAVDDVDRFVNDRRPGAYERLVDRLLASARYGERWGGHWLDVARYADSNGFTIDSSRSIWKYRDWVINALNHDLPFDEFTIEQIAGDLLPGATIDQMIATGFHRNTLINEEGGTDDEQFRVEAIVDRVNTTGAVWLGLTLGCAQCHSHKYDPVTQREYYQLYAFFNNTIDHNQEMPLVDVPTDEQAGRRADLKEVVRSSEGVLADYEVDLAEEERAWEAEVAKELPVRWVELDAPELTSSAGASFERLDDGSYLASGELVDSDSYSLTGAVPGKAVAGAAGTPGRITAVRIDALTHDSLPDTGPGRANNGNFFLSEIELSSGENVAKWETSYAEKGKSERAIDDDPATGWSLNIAHSEGNVSTRGVFVIEGAGLPISSEGLRLTLRQESRPRFLLGRFRVLVTTSRPERVRMPFDVRASIATPQEERGDEAKAIVSAAHRRTDATWRNLAAHVDEAKDALKTFVDSIPTTMVLREREDRRTTHVQIRGDFLRKGAVVFPDVPSVLPPLAGEPQSRTRLDLAQWLVDPRNPLTARVTVNRIWQRYFGLGLVETENDFGLRGSQPTHPQLLDWLASDFVRGGWRLKRLHRLIVTSATYRQASHIRRDLPVTDPQNRLLARQSRFRLEAEVIRDVALDASGLLTDVLGGPGVFPPQPKGIYVFTQRDKQWQDSLGADRYRRGLYTFFWRSGPYPFLTTFDKTKANVTCTRRVRSNTPLQALTMANDAAIVEFARGLAARVLRERGDARQEERLRFAFRLCFGRSPEEMELRRLNGFFESQLEEFRGDSEAAYKIVHGTPEPTQNGDSGSATQSTSEPKLNDPPVAAAVLQVSDGVELAEAAAWTSVARVLMNLDEFVTRE